HPSRIGLPCRMRGCQRQEAAGDGGRPHADGHEGHSDDLVLRELWDEFAAVSKRVKRAAGDITVGEDALRQGLANGLDCLPRYDRRAAPRCAAAKKFSQYEDVREVSMATSFKINGKTANSDAPPATPLLWVIREELKLTGTKFGCGTGLCGACM